jgi:penicillin-binding protein 1C
MSQKNKKNKKINKKIFLKNIIAICILCFFVGTGIIALWSTTLTLPNLENFDQRQVTESTKIYDRTGEILLYDIHGDIKRTVVPLNEISPLVQQATIAIEDKNFYNHHGIEISAIVRAIVKNLAKGDLFGGQGGSTITQQVLKNALLTTDKKVSRKIKEWVLAPKLERLLTKDQILEIYLNEVPYGGNVYGIQEASRRFFGKDSKDLNLVESAYLAALPQAPTFYSPYGNNVDRLEFRKNHVLDQMVLVGDITPEQADEAKNITMEFEKQEAFGIKAPHFVFYVRELLEQKYGQDVIQEDGLKVTTSLNWELQEAAEEIVLKKALENEEKVNAENAAIIATDPQTGEILVMVGSRNYFDDEIDGNFNIVTSERQPGSVFKPFVYAEAFNKGYWPETVVFDLETEFSTACNEELKEQIAENTNFETDEETNCYTPGNYDNIFRGPMSLRDALAQSVNIPAVKALYLAGLRDSLNLAKKMGINTLNNVDQYGLTLVLGGGEVRPIDVATAYSVFASDGIKNEKNPILKIENSAGDILFDIEEERNNSQRVLSEQTARLINDVLSDNNARTPAFGVNSPLYFPGRDVAAKTGTTNDYRDAWIVGYTPNITAVAWAGNNDNSPMEKKVASFIVSPMWNEFMQIALEKLEHNDFMNPEPIKPETKPILAGYWKGEELSVIENDNGEKISAVTGKTDGIHSILYYVDKNDPLGPKPSRPEIDPQFPMWEKSVKEWIKKQNISDDFEISDPKKEQSVSLNIISLEDGGFYNPDSEFVIVAEISDGRVIKKGSVYINNNKIGNLEIPNNSLFFIPNEVDYIEDINYLRVEVVDTQNNTFVKEIKFNIK